jgi:hypothetical protein
MLNPAATKRLSRRFFVKIRRLGGDDRRKIAKINETFNKNAYLRIERKRVANRTTRREQEKKEKK